MIVLRQENFGAIAFNPENATELWLDQGFFNLFKNDHQSNKLEEIYKKLDCKNKSFEIIKRINQPTKYPFQVLSGPTLADVNITNKCNLNCPHCYMNSNKYGSEMKLEDYLLVLDECKKNGVLQIALGGGEPTTHSSFGKILKETRKRNIVPNLTTNGKQLSFKTVYLLAKYAGAVALSVEEIGDKFETRRGFKYLDFLKSVKKLKAAGVKVVFQITVGESNLPRLEETLKELVKYKPYGIIFLAYKPQGRGVNFDKPVSAVDKKEVQKTFKNIFKILKGKTKVGFDCCLTPTLFSIKNSEEFTGCSSTRMSVAIMANLNVMPCSFMDKKGEYDNLKEKSLSEIWQGQNFNDFRNKIQKKYDQSTCQSCDHRNTCLGGCPIFNLSSCYRF